MVFFLEHLNDKLQYFIRNMLNRKFTLVAALDKLLKEKKTGKKKE
jgi:hypothetical protein